MASIFAALPRKCCGAAALTRAHETTAAARAHWLTLRSNCAASADSDMFWLAGKLEE
jgi:hypothetical protein